MPSLVKQLSAVRGTTQVVGIIGYPIQHSLSPVMQNAAFAAGNLDYVYVPFPVTPESLAQAVTGLMALGVCGFNVTIPHKTAIIPLLDQLSESAESAGAVNTVQMCGSSLIGHNTDGDGLVDSLATDLDYHPGSGSILVIGAGGAARGAIAALCRSGAADILICNRSPEKAEGIVTDMSIRYPDTRITVISQPQVREDLLGSITLVLNTTSLGMNNERIEFINLAHVPDHAKVYDMVYGKSATPLVKEATALGLPAVNGVGMLVAQGERAFAIWTGQRPPEGVMRQALGCV